MEDALQPSPARAGRGNAVTRRRRARAVPGTSQARIALLICVYVLTQALLPHLHWGQVARVEAATRIEAAAVTFAASSHHEAPARVRTAPSPDSEHHESTCAVCQARAQSAKFLPSPAAHLLRVATRSSAIAGGDVVRASVATGAKSARAPPLLS